MAYSNKECTWNARVCAGVWEPRAERREVITRMARAAKSFRAGGPGTAANLAVRYRLRCDSSLLQRESSLRSHFPHRYLPRSTRRHCRMDRHDVPTEPVPGMFSAVSSQNRSDAKPPTRHPPSVAVDSIESNRVGRLISISTPATLLFGRARLRLGGSVSWSLCRCLTHQERPKSLHSVCVCETIRVLPASASDSRRASCRAVASRGTDGTTPEVVRQGAARPLAHPARCPSLFTPERRYKSGPACKRHQAGTAERQ